MSKKEKYGLLGKTLNHSFSKGYFTEKFLKEGIEATYENFEIDSIEHFKDLLQQEGEGLKGLNVTIPYKESILPYLDHIDSVAKTVGAVNTVKFKDDSLVGYNTDVFGFKQMIKPFFKPIHEKALILGTGGAAKAVAYVLEELGCEVIYLSRNPTGMDQFGYEDANEMMLDIYKLVVNCTPVGTFPKVDDCIDLPYNSFSSQHLAVDLIYNPSETAFLKKAKARGAVVLNGLTMLEQQAEQSWRLWNDI